MTTPGGDIERMRRLVGRLGVDDPRGVEVRPSSLRNAGLGLFALRAFAAGESITEYAGQRINRAEAERRVAAGLGGKIRVVESHHVYLDGAMISADNRGLGSFTNDGRMAENNNADFTCVWDKVTTSYRVWVTATRTIRPDEEVLASYGRDYWRRESASKPVVVFVTRAGEVVVDGKVRGQVDVVGKSVREVASEARCAVAFAGVALDDGERAYVDPEDVAARVLEWGRLVFEGSK